MRTVAMYQVDAFTNRLFGGNPAAVVPLGREWLPETLMQQIAAENNLAETAFLTVGPTDGYGGYGGYGIRWFTPTTEVDLCGHATLASAFVVARFLEPEEAGHDGAGAAVDAGPGVDAGPAGRWILFDSPKSGRLPVAVEPGGESFTLDFPADPVRVVSPPPGLAEAIGVEAGEVLETLQGRSDLMCVLSSAARVGSLVPDYSALAELPARGLIVTAAGEGPGSEAPEATGRPAQADFVSRFFAPRVGIPEDPVTGSAHTTLAPYWADRLGKRALEAWQLSPRGGKLSCRVEGDRVHIAGAARLYLRGEICIGP